MLYIILEGILLKVQHDYFERSIFVIVIWSFPANYPPEHFTVGRYSSTPEKYILISIYKQSKFFFQLRYWAPRNLDSYLENTTRTSFCFVKSHLGLYCSKWCWAFQVGDDLSLWLSTPNSHVTRIYLCPLFPVVLVCLLKPGTSDKTRLLRQTFLSIFTQPQIPLHWRGRVGAELSNYNCPQLNLAEICIN